MGHLQKPRRDSDKGQFVGELNVVVLFGQPEEEEEREVVTLLASLSRDPPSRGGFSGNVSKRKQFAEMQISCQSVVGERKEEIYFIQIDLTESMICG